MRAAEPAKACRSVWSQPRLASPESRRRGHTPVQRLTWRAATMVTTPRWKLCQTRYPFHRSGGLLAATVIPHRSGLFATGGNHKGHRTVGLRARHFKLARGSWGTARQQSGAAIFCVAQSGGKVLRRSGRTAHDRSSQHRPL